LFIIYFTSQLNKGIIIPYPYFPIPIAGIEASFYKFSGHIFYKGKGGVSQDLPGELAGIRSLYISTGVETQGR
jgi:hypothetical protein